MVTLQKYECTKTMQDILGVGLIALGRFIIGHIVTGRFEPWTFMYQHRYSTSFRKLDESNFDHHTSDSENI
jgi:hypothetical protein